jgi:hypothetical protein
VHGGTRLRGRFLAFLPAAALLGGCGGAVPVDAAPGAADPDCAAVIASLEGADEVAGRERREVAAQSAAAWGDPPLVLRCGVAPPGPTTEGCVSVNGVDWVGPTDPSEGGTWTTYGRVPAVEVVVPRAAARDATLDVVLAQVSPAVAGLPRQRQCF